MIRSLRRKHFIIWLIIPVVLVTAIVLAYLGSLLINNTNQ
jgi:hypothetical protein